jgi:hypothetical protein
VYAKVQSAPCPAKLGRAAVGEQIGKRRKRQVDEPHHVGTQTGAHPRRLDRPCPEQRLDGQRAAIALATHLEACWTDTGAERLLLYLGPKHEALQIGQGHYPSD